MRKFSTSPLHIAAGGESDIQRINELINGVKLCGLRLAEGNFVLPKAE